MKPTRVARDDFDRVVRMSSRESTFVVDGTENPDVGAATAQRLLRTKRNVVLVSPQYAFVDGVKCVGSMEELQGRFVDIAGPSTMAIGQSDAFVEQVSKWTYAAQLNVRNRHARSRRYAENFVANMPRLMQPSLMTASGVYAGVPAFIVGAGPSLDRNREAQARMREHGLVIAVNGAGRALPEPPHITLTVEVDDTSELIGDPRDSLVCACVSSHPNVLSEYDANVLWTCPLSGLAEYLTGEPPLRSIITASGTAIDLALRLGCHPIVLVGQDLGYVGRELYASHIGGELDEAGRTSWGAVHKRTKYREGGLPGQLLMCEATSQDGAPMRTTKQLRVFIEWLGRIATNEGVVGINASEQGAMVPWWPNASLSDVLDMLPIYDVTHPREVAKRAGAVEEERYREWRDAVENSVDAFISLARQYADMSDTELSNPTDTMRLHAVERHLRQASELGWWWSNPVIVETTRAHLGASPLDDVVEEYRAEVKAIRAMCDAIVSENNDIHCLRCPK